MDYNEYLEVTFNTIDEGITIYDEDLRLVVWNDQYSRMGITPPEDLYRGSSLLASYTKMAQQGIFGDGDPNELARARIDAIKSGPLIESELLTATTKRLIRINRFPLNNGGICATFRDITEERHNELLLRQAAKLDAIGRLTGGLAHDLNNVLAIIVSSLEVIESEVVESKEQVGWAFEATERGAKLIHGLLAFARQQPLESANISVQTPLNRISPLLPNLVGERIQVSLLCADDLWTTRIDVNQFESTILNFVANARDAMPNGGCLTITATNENVDQEISRSAGIKTGQFVCVSVTDTGVGMSAETAEKIFDPFFTTKPVGLGTGLGLSMAHGFAKQSGGNVRVDSKEQSGTVVSLYLPRTLESKTIHVHSVAKETNQSELMVLIVEDDNSLRQATSVQASSLGCEVLSASSGDEALALARAMRIDVLLTDMVMPGMSGYALAHSLLKLQPALAVVFMSGYSDESGSAPDEQSIQAVSIRKPFRSTELSSAFDRAMANVGRSRQ